MNPSSNSNSNPMINPTTIPTTSARLDVLLSNSYFLAHEPMHGAHGQPYPSLGVLYLAAYLRTHTPWAVGLFDATFAGGYADFTARLVAERPKIVGIQGLITTRRTCRQLIALAKQAGAIVVTGGPDPSCDPESYLDWGADFVVIGEGEATLLELATHLLATADPTTWAEIAGLAYRQAGTTTRTAPRPYIADLDALPLPAYDLIDVQRYLAAWREANGYASMHVLMSRGCPFACEWCSHAVFGRTFRQRSVASVIAEVRYLQTTYAPDHLTFADDTLGLNRKWFNAWCDAMAEQQLGMPFRCFSRADVIDLPMAQRLRALGCRHIYLGVESGSQRILDQMQKGTRLADIRTASAAIKTAGIDLGYFIMFGYPGETADDIRQTEALINTMQPDSLGLSIAYPVPGTAFHQKVAHLVYADRTEDEVLMGSSRQLKFATTYPGVYYRRLIESIELAWQLRTRPGGKPWRTQLHFWWDRTLVRLLELNWPWLKHMVRQPLR